MQLSKLENKTYEKLKDNNIYIFKIKDLVLLENISRQKAYNIVKSLKNKGIIKNIGKGYLSFKDVNEFVLATNINYPSYISFWSALNYYGFSDQMPKKIFLVTTKYTKEINNFKYINLSKNRFFGYIQIGEITIAEKEKAIIDSLLFPKYSGGIKEVINSLKSSLKEIDINKLINYAVNIKSNAVLRRLGFILEFIGYKGSLNKFKKRIGKGYELLDPSLKRKNSFNKKWLLDINI